MPDFSEIDPENSNRRRIFLFNAGSVLCGKP